MKSIFVFLAAALMVLGFSTVGFSQTQDQLGYSYNQLGPMEGYGSAHMGRANDSGAYEQSQMGTDEESNSDTYGQSTMSTDNGVNGTDIDGQSGASQAEGSVSGSDVSR